MTAPARPLVVIAGKINPAGVAQLESEARVVITPDQETEDGDRAGARGGGHPLPRGPALRRRHPRRVPARARRGAPRRGPRHGRPRVGHAARRRRGPRARLELAGRGRARPHAHAGVRQAHGGDRPDDAQGRLEPPAPGRATPSSPARPSASSGIGNVGRRVARFAGAIGMRVLGYDKYVPADEVRRRGAEPVGSLDELLPQVDVLTCHTPLTPGDPPHDRRARARAACAPARSSSTRRAGPSTASGRSSRRSSRSGWPPRVSTSSSRSRARVDNPIFNLDNVVCSGHVAGVTLEANREASLQVTAEILRVLRGERPKDLANPDVWPRPAQRR